MSYSRYKKYIYTEEEIVDICIVVKVDVAAGIACGGLKTAEVYEMLR